MRYSFWSEEENEELLELYGTIPNKELASRFHRTPNALQHQYAKLTHPKTNPSRHWSKKEVSYMYAHYGNMGSESIGRKLGRTKIAVRKKAASLGLVCYTEYWTLKFLAKAFHSDSIVIHRWNEKYGMPMKRVKQGHIYSYRISPEAFWKWASTHQDIVPWQKYQRGALSDEPAWLDSVRPSAMHSREPLTEARRRRIYALMDGGHTFREIAELEGRTINSIRHISKQRREYEKTKQKTAS